eukprot:TRINITY_DN67713_c1_g1_i3.p1 TRINITY_DN67713_c1_g1~~TRINITY_DN67713_c1_g1_i3.p1  ORF type:complete len:466 (-),score=187.20 TRINITY_DN67713_c1_g1_i3:150-1418(-)
MRVMLALRHSPEQLAWLEKQAEAVSQPDSPKYRQFVAPSELHERMAPPRSDVEAVRKWVEGVGGVVVVTELMNGAVLQLDAPHSFFEQLLATRLAVFESVGQKRPRRIVRAVEAVHVPSEVAHIVEIVGDLQSFPTPRRHRRRDHEQQRLAPPSNRHGDWKNDCTGDVKGLQCAGWITPGVIRDRYNLTNVTRTTQVASGVTNGAAVAEFEQEFYDDADLKLFSTACNLSPPVAVVATKGGKNKPSVCSEVGECTESLMDIEYLGAAAGGDVPLTMYYNEEYSIYTYVVDVISDFDASAGPWVHSVSWGTDEDTWTAEDMQRTNVELQKAAALGISIFVSSGDNGVIGAGSGNSNVFRPQFPASSPWVTTVGGTYFANHAIGEEAGASWSGGGFSNTFARPSWQKQAVASYFDTVDSLPPQT